MKEEMVDRNTVERNLKNLKNVNVYIHPSFIVRRTLVI